MRETICEHSLAHAKFALPSLLDGHKVNPFLIQDEDFLTGVRLEVMHDLVDWTATSDGVIVF